MRYFVLLWNPETEKNYEIIFSVFFLISFFQYIYVWKYFNRHFYWRQLIPEIENDNENFEPSPSTSTPDDLHGTEILYHDIEELLATFNEPETTNEMPIDDADDPEINNNIVDNDDDKKLSRDPRTYTITITYLKREKKKKV